MQMELDRFAAAGGGLGGGGNGMDGVGGAGGALSGRGSGLGGSGGGGGGGKGGAGLGISAAVAAARVRLLEGQAQEEMRRQHQSQTQHYHQQLGSSGGSASSLPAADMSAALNEGIAAESLLKAVGYGHLDVLRVLLRRGVSPHIVSADGLSALALAVACGQLGRSTCFSTTTPTPPPR